MEGTKDGNSFHELWSQVIAEHPFWLSTPSSDRAEHFLGSDDQVEEEIMVGRREFFIGDLETMDGRRHSRGSFEGADLPADRVFQIGVAATLADADRPEGPGARRP